MDFNEQKIRNYSYFIGSYCPSLHYQRRTKEKSLSAPQKWCYRLLVRNHLTFRAVTHIDQEHSENYKEKMFEFRKLVESYRKCNDSKLDQIKNMDETPLFLNMARTKTIAKIGSKTVNIKTHGQENVRVTEIL